MPSSRRRAKKRRNERDAKLREYFRRLEATLAVALAGVFSCQCCEDQATYLHRADQSPWCGRIVCQTVDAVGRMVTKPRDPEMVAFATAMHEAP